LATLQPPLLMSFREPNGAVMKVNMKRLGWERSIGASSLRGLQGRSATNQNGQAAEEKKENMPWGLDAAKTFLASGSGRCVFRLTSPLIGLPRRWGRRALSRTRCVHSALQELCPASGRIVENSPCLWPICRWSWRPQDHHHALPGWQRATAPADGTGPPWTARFDAISHTYVFAGQHH
jgi:hypothetical protein